MESGCLSDVSHRLRRRNLEHAGPRNILHPLAIVETFAQHLLNNETFINFLRNSRYMRTRCPPIRESSTTARRSSRQSARQRFTHNHYPCADIMLGSTIALISQPVWIVCIRHRNHPFPVDDHSSASGMQRIVAIVYSHVSPRHFFVHCNWQLCGMLIILARFSYLQCLQIQMQNLGAWVLKESRANGVQTA